MGRPHASGGCERHPLLAPAADFATRRLYPDEIVCCGPHSVLLPYIDPGIALAKAIKESVDDFREREGRSPRVVLLTNHGLITPGGNVAAVLAATSMAVKAAEISTLAAANGGPTFLSEKDVARIDSRTDEHYRRKQLNL